MAETPVWEIVDNIPFRKCQISTGGIYTNDSFNSLFFQNKTIKSGGSHAQFKSECLQSQLCIYKRKKMVNENGLISNWWRFPILKKQ